MERIARIQEQLLNDLRKKNKRCTIYLTNGMPLKGKILAFDQFVLLIEDEKQNHKVVYKHAVSTIDPHGQITL